MLRKNYGKGGFLIKPCFCGSKLNPKISHRCISLGYNSNCDFSNIFIWDLFSKRNFNNRSVPAAVVVICDEAGHDPFEALIDSHLDPTWILSIEEEVRNSDSEGMKCLTHSNQKSVQTKHKKTVQWRYGHRKHCTTRLICLQTKIFLYQN